MSNKTYHEQFHRDCSVKRQGAYPRIILMVTQDRSELKFVCALCEKKWDSTLSSYPMDWCFHRELKSSNIILPGSDFKM
jgi:hypothetical protein